MRRKAVWATVGVIGALLTLWLLGGAGFLGIAYPFHRLSPLVRSTAAVTRVAAVATVRVAISPTLIPTLYAMGSETPTPRSGSGLAVTLNGVPVKAILVMPEAARQHIQEIYNNGQALGRNPHAFSKVGDSTMAWPPLLSSFDDRNAYSLSEYAYLQPTVERYGGSFARDSVAVCKGMHTWSEFDPAWTPQGLCGPDEGPLECESGLHNPSIMIIRLGANDALMPMPFEENLRKIVDFCVARGIIPILGTKPDRVEGPANTINQIIRRVAEETSVPLWDYDLIAATVPGRGLAEDRVHFIGGGSHDYALSGAFASADSLEDLTALMMLDAVSREVAGAEAP